METDMTPPTPGAAFRQRLLEVRKQLDITQRQLVDQLADVGLPMNQAAIARIENGSRKVSLDEAVAIAAVLDIAPVHLFLPIDGDQGTGRERHGPPVRLAPGLDVDQVKARRWARGELPLRPANFWTYLQQSPGDVRVSAEELSPEQQAEIRARHEAVLRQLGVNPEDLPQPTQPPAIRPEVHDEAAAISRFKPGDRPGANSKENDG